MKNTPFAILALGVLICVFAVDGYAQDAGMRSESAALSPGQKVKQPPPPRVSGGWCGTVQDNLLGPGNLDLAIKQKKEILSGSWTDDFGGFGVLTGKIVGDALTVRLRDKASKCKLQVNGILVSPDEVTGTYSQFGCRQADGGSFDITTNC